MFIGNSNQNQNHSTNQSGTNTDTHCRHVTRQKRLKTLQKGMQNFAVMCKASVFHQIKDKNGKIEYGGTPEVLQYFEQHVSISGEKTPIPTDQFPVQVTPATVTTTTTPTSTHAVTSAFHNITALQLLQTLTLLVVPVPAVAPVAPAVARTVTTTDQAAPAVTTAVTIFPPTMTSTAAPPLTVSAPTMTTTVSPLASTITAPALATCISTHYDSYSDSSGINTTSSSNNYMSPKNDNF